MGAQELANQNYQDFLNKNHEKLPEQVLALWKSIMQNEQDTDRNKTEVNTSNGTQDRPALNNTEAAKAKPSPLSEIAELYQLGFRLDFKNGMVIFPGIKMEQLELAIKNSKKQKNQFYPDPEMTVTHVTTTGKFSFLFNQPMLLPVTPDHEIYSKIFNLSIIPAIG